MFPLKAKLVRAAGVPCFARRNQDQIEVVLLKYLPARYRRTADRLIQLSQADIQRKLASFRCVTRESYLAYGFLRLRPYRMIENKVRPGNEPNWGRVAELITYHSGADERLTRQQLEAWKVSPDTKLSDEAKAELNLRWQERIEAKKNRATVA